MATEQPYYDPAKFVLLHKSDPGAEPFTHPDSVVAKEVPIQVPIALVRGHLEKLTDEELEHVRADIGAEITRRNAVRVNTERAQQALQRDQGGNYG